MSLKRVSKFAIYTALLTLPFVLGYVAYPVLFVVFGKHWWLLSSCLLAVGAVVATLFYGKSRERAEIARQHISKMSSLANIASGVGHNLNNRFNNLLTLVNMYFLKYGEAQDLLKLSQEDLKARQIELIKLLKQIREESHRGFDIAAILSKSAKQPVKPQSFYIEEAVKLAFDLLRAKIESQHITLIEDYPKQGPKVYASLSHMQDVLFSIGDNAYDALIEKERLIRQIKHSEAYFTPIITIRAGFSKSKATITIADNGIGIKPENLSKVGQPFYSTKSCYREGIGLGLWMARCYLQMNGGNLTIASTYTKGTIITLTVPVAS